MQGNIAMAGTLQPGAAQVFLRDTGLRFDANGVDVLHYSQAARLLLAVRRSSLTAYSIDRREEAPQVNFLLLGLLLGTLHKLPSCTAYVESYFLVAERGE